MRIGLSGSGWTQLKLTVEIRELDLNLKFTIQNGIRGILVLQNTTDTYPPKASKKTAILVAES